MIQHEIIPIFSQEWWLYNVITIPIIIGIIFWGRSLSAKNINRLTLTIASLFIFEFFFMGLGKVSVDPGSHTAIGAVPQDCGIWIASEYAGSLAFGGFEF